MSLLSRLSALTTSLHDQERAIRRAVGLPDAPTPPATVCDAVARLENTVREAESTVRAAVGATPAQPAPELSLAIAERMGRVEEAKERDSVAAGYAEAAAGPALPDRLACVVPCVAAPGVCEIDTGDGFEARNDVPPGPTLTDPVVHEAPPHKGNGRAKRRK